MNKQKTISIKRLYKMRIDFLKMTDEDRPDHYEYKLVTSFIEYVNEHRND